MSGNTEPTSNSMKFAPMPLSALLANLMPLQSREESPDCSADESDDSDNSFLQTVSKKTSSDSKSQPKHRKSTSKEFFTPNFKSSQPKDIKAFVSEKKLVRNDYNKENDADCWISNQTYPNNDGLMQNAPKPTVKTNPPSSEVKRSVLVPHNIVRTQRSTLKQTPEVKAPSIIANSVHKTKTPTPKIKSGIRKFTPGSSKKSQRKTPQKTLAENRDRVRCELFSLKKPKDEPQCPPSKAEVQAVTAAAQAPAPVPETPLNRKPETPLNRKPETPLNRRPMPMSYAATPSYPQNTSVTNSKILKSTRIKNKNYVFLKMIGKGGSSEVYKVLEMSTSMEYAVKCVNVGIEPDQAQGYINEVRLLRKLQDSDRVIRLYDYEYDKTNQLLRIVLEAGETDLSSFLKARGAGLPPALVLHYWEEMLQAVLYIHEHGVVHADLKPANFLLVCGRLKLIDFGIASTISSDATSVVRAQATGTYSYISPEALMGGAGGYGAGGHALGTAPIKISFRSDVWSLGCILYSLVYGRTPFGHIPNLAKLPAILDPNHRIDYPPVEHVPSSLMAALKWCLTYNARERPFVRQLLDIPYMQPARVPLPRPLLDKLQPMVTPHEYRLLQRAQLHPEDCPR